MSILLKALKKSEQQRQLGATPTLSTPVENHPASGQNERRWVPLSMLALSAIVMAWIGWNQYRPPFSVMPALSKAQEKAAAGTEESGAEESAEVMDSREPAPPAAARTPVESFQAGEPAPEDALDTSDSTPVDPDRRQQVSQSFRSFSPETPAAEADMDDPADAPAALAPAIEGEADLAENARDMQAAEPPARMDPHIPEPISYWEIPQSVRENMPEIKISVLVFAAEPEDRFVLINGQRLVEKDNYTGGVRLDEIRRDGAVFIYRNYRFLVKG